MKKIISLIGTWMIAGMLTVPASPAGTSFGKSNKQTDFSNTFQEKNEASAFVTYSRSLETTGDSGQLRGGIGEIDPPVPVADGVSVLLLAGLVYGLFAVKRVRDRM
ncbi:MAG: hypothetical protein LBN18_08980 [Dysgonamonadaceae bacterium]|nr:hypothetical protein [Dysgonamonadaceae bacterium]